MYREGGGKAAQTHIVLDIVDLHGGRNGVFLAALESYEPQ
jgi:hypothetical protein